jgi:hypothetical protein
MNPELQRNLWLELSPIRLIMMPAVIGLIFAAVWTTWGFGSEATGQLGAVAAAARFIYFFIVVIWGTWIAARLVTGEIRDRTWDFQRMSAISSWSMVTGKLIGGTAFVWYGGLICLVPIVMHTAATGGGDEVAREILFRVGMGLFAHASAFFVSMLAVRRMAASSRLASFFAMVAGIGAAAWVWWVWVGTKDWPIDVQFTWFHIEMAAPTFMVISLLLFAGWAILGNWTLMRHELQIPTGPLVWIGFILFAMVYYAGQADFFGILDELGQAAHRTSKATGGAVGVDGIPDSVLTSTRWAIAFAVALSLTYIAIIVAPKNWVQLRQARQQFLGGRVPQALWNLPSWGYTIIAAVVAAIFLTGTLAPITVNVANDLPTDWTITGVPLDGVIDLRPTVFALLAFMIRDVGIVLWFNAAKRARRPDLAAVVTLWVLHSVVPALLAGTQALALLSFVSPWPVNGDSWMQPVWPALEAALVFFLVAARRGMVRSRA